ncbi:MAG: hypothetical protein PHD02_04740 [Bacilli bacterium]|nr:hypothetical protein [Bacilli bacterium]
MNSEGWGLRIMLFFCACLMFALIVSASILNTSFKHNTSKDIEVTAVTYYDLEVRMVNAAKNYIYDNYNDISKATIPISLSTLINNNYIGPINDPDTKENCSGYVIFTKDKNNTQYDPYLRCGTMYKTNGYELQYEN